MSEAEIKPAVDDGVVVAANEAKEPDAEPKKPAVRKNKGGRPRIDPTKRKVGGSVSLKMEIWTKLGKLAKKKEMSLSGYVESIIERHLKRA